MLLKQGNVKLKGKTENHIIRRKINASVESVAQVVGRRTQDHKVMSSTPDSGLISEVAVKL